MKVFSEIRERYPAYQIAIFKISAPARGSVGYPMQYMGVPTQNGWFIRENPIEMDEN